MTCEECQDRIIFYLSRQLSPAEEGEFKRHLNECDACQKEFELNERFTRSLHNVSIPFRQAAGRIEANLLNMPGPSGSEGAVRRILRLVRARPRVYVFAGVGGLVVLAFVVALLLTRNVAQVDPLVTWAVQHYSLIDQTHPLRGDAETVRAWFRDHHQIEVVPPRNVDYTELVGCKMLEMDSDPSPLLRFGGPEPCAVFILPARFKTHLGERADIRLEKDGYRVHVWVEGNHPFLQISKIGEV